MSVEFVDGSFRDRSARVLFHNEQVYRVFLEPDALEQWTRLRASSGFNRLIQQKKLIDTRQVPIEEIPDLPGLPAISAVLWHERVPFISYPYEWCFGMLKDAALLQLEILNAALSDQFILKDATPYNVQFMGARPTFIDLGSFVTLQPGEPWSAYRQFCELFLYPLMLHAYRGVSFHTLLRGELEGLSADEASKWFSWRDWLRRGVFSHVVMHAFLARVAKSQPQSTLKDLQKTGFPRELIQRNVERLTRLVQKLNWEPRRSLWSDYDQTSSMVAQDSDVKSAFVKATAQSQRWKLVWDLGCNLGRYSIVTAEFADYVLAMDFDHECVETLYRQLKAQGPNNVLPLRMNLANQSPALGWRGRERWRLEERGQPDLVLCLGLIHHLVIAANIPLAEVLDWLASTTTNALVIEFPTKQDPMVQALLRNKRDQYHDYSQENFERLLAARFEISEKIQLPSTERFLYRAFVKNVRQ